MPIYNLRLKKPEEMVGPRLDFSNYVPQQSAGGPPPSQPFNSNVAAGFFQGGANEYLGGTIRNLANLALGSPLKYGNPVWLGARLGGVDIKPQDIIKEIAPEQGTKQNSLAPLSPSAPGVSAGTKFGGVVKEAQNQALAAIASAGVGNAISAALPATSQAGQVLANMAKLGAEGVAYRTPYGLLSGESPGKATVEGAKFGAFNTITGGATSFIPNVGKTPIVRALPRAAVGAAAGYKLAPLAGTSPTAGAIFGAIGAGGAKPVDYKQLATEGATQAGHIQPGADLTVPNSGNSQYTTKLLAKAHPEVTAGLSKAQINELYQTAQKAPASVVAGLDSRPAHQVAIEDALNKGDIKTAKQLVAKIPKNDPYRASMESFVNDAGVQTAKYNQKTNPLEALKAEARQATGARSDYSPENLQANRQIRAKNASSITYADKKAIKPDELVTVYRAVPGKAKGGLTEGDWVTPNKEQARLFMKQSWAQDDTGAKIVTKKVKASELRYHADDAKGYVDDELLYVPKSDPLEALKQEARKYKSAEEFGASLKPEQIQAIKQAYPNKGILDAVETIYGKPTSKVASGKLETLNPTGGLYTEYTPKTRATMPLGDNIKTLAHTTGKNPDEIITIYRGAPTNQKGINPGDFITTDPNLARTYTGDSNVLSKKVRLGDVLDDVTEPGGGEYIYRPKADKQLTDLYNQTTKGKTIYSNYTGPVPETPKSITVAANEASAPTGKFGNARSLQPNELQAIQGGMKQKVAGNVKANISALEMDKALQQVDSNNNISQGYKAFSDIQAGKYNNTEAGKLLRSAFDDAHREAIQAGMSPGYIDNYIPQMWKQGDKQVAKILQSNGIKINPGFAAHRQIPSYEWGIEHGLTPKYNKVSQLYGAYTQQLESAKANIGLINNMRDAGILTAANKAPAGWEPMNLKGFEGMAAPPHVTKVLKSVIGPIDQPAQVVAQKVAAFNSGWQNIVLSGGIPYTPENFFVYGQLFKETSTGLGGTVGLLKGDTLGVKRLGVWADFIRAHSGEMTNNQILKNKDLITGLADRGVDLRFQSQISAPSAWHRAIDNPTFGRFLPLTELRTARDVVAQATKKGMSNSEAMDLAAEAIHNYHGINNNLVGLRSKDVQNMITATTFAPQFRESLLNVYGNTAKAFTPGSGQAATLNRYLATGLGMAFLGYNLLNQKLNGGKNMWQNEPGKEMSLQIPYGEPDSRGIRKAIFIPFAPSFFTVPRNLVEGTSALAHGDVPQFGRNMSSNLAMPLQLAGQLVSNRDYYGRPIYNTEETVDINNQPPDSPAAVAGKMGSYAFKQASIPSVRGLVEYFGEKKPAGQALATGLELPLRYGKITPEETQSYFKARDQVLNKASKATRDDYKAIHSGDNGAPTPFYSSAEKATSMIKENGGLTELYQVEKSIAQRENNKYPSDPLYNLPDDKAFVVLKLQQLQGTARGGAESKQLKADNPWLSDFYKQRTAFYDSQNIPEKDRVMPPYEEPSSAVAAKLDQYNTLAPADKTNFLRANPDVTDYFAKSFDYTNLVRKMQGVAEFAKRPQPSAQTQAKLDYYNTLPKGTGARSSFLRGNPDVTQFFADLKFYDEAGPFGTGIAAGGGGSNKNLAKITDSVYGANSQYASSKSYSKTYSPKVKPFYYSQGYKTPRKLGKPAVSVPRKVGAAPIKIVAKKSKA